jgi:hypothetical protein
MELDTTSHASASAFSDPVDETSIRLLRFSQSEDGVFIGKLQKFPVAVAPHYYAASYVWGDHKYTGTTIDLQTGRLPVLDKLVPFLHMVTRHVDFKALDWWWIDSLCINLDDSREREKQVQIMADIYKGAKRAIIWLGEENDDGGDCTYAIDFLHYLSTLQIAFNGDDLAMRKKLENPEFIDKCAAVSNLLARPWWTRVWTLQEFVLPKEAKLYCGMASISRGKFKSAIYSIFLCSTISKEFKHELVPRKLFDGAFNRRRVHQWHTKPASIGINLIAIMAYLGNHSATDSRDRIYSVLGLITEQDRELIGPAEYTTDMAHQFARLVRSFWNTHNSLDIVCFSHLFSRNTAVIHQGTREAVPTWAPDWSATIDFVSPVPLMASQSACKHIGNFRPLRSTCWEAMYDAPGTHLREEAAVCFSDDLKVLSCNGVVLDTVHGLGGLDEQELRCRSSFCNKNDHALMQSRKDQQSDLVIARQPMELLEAIARSLVIDRQDRYLCFKAPIHYVSDFLSLCHACIDGNPVDWSFSTWFEHNRQLCFGNTLLEDLVKQVPTEFASPPPALHRPPSHHMYHMDKKLETFLSRLHDTVRKKARRLMVTKQGYVGVAPCHARLGDGVAILSGCSIPLVLRRNASRDAWEVVGEGFIYDYMDGEIEHEVKSGRVSVRRLRLI